MKTTEQELGLRFHVAFDDEGNWVVWGNSWTIDPEQIEQQARAELERQESGRSHMHTTRLSVILNVTHDAKDAQDRVTDLEERLDDAIHAAMERGERD